MSLQLNFTGVQASQPLTPVPAGTYQVSVRGVKPKQSSTGKPMLEWCFEVEDGGEYNGRRIFTNTILEPTSLWRTKDFLLALGFTEEELAADFELDPAEMVGLMAMATVTIKKYNGDDRNEVGRLMPLASAAAGTPEWASAVADDEELVADQPDEFYAEAQLGPEDGEPDDDEDGELTFPDDDEEGDPGDDEEGEPGEPEEYVIPDDVKITATARKTAIENQIPLDQITPSGPGKTITEKDLKAWLAVSA